MKIKQILKALRANREGDISLLCLEDEEFLLRQYILHRAKIKDLETTILNSAEDLKEFKEMRWYFPKEYQKLKEMLASFNNQKSSELEEWNKKTPLRNYIHSGCKELESSK